MSITLLDIKNETRDLLNESYTDRSTPTLPGEPFFLDVELLTWINNGIHDLAEDTGINYKVVEYTMTASEAGETEVALSTIIGANTLLKKFSVDWLDNGDDNQNWYQMGIASPIVQRRHADESGSIQACSYYNETFYFTKEVEAGDKIAISGWYDIDDLSADADTWDYCNKSKMFLISNTIYKGFIKRRIADLAAFYKSERDKYFSDVYKKYENNLKLTIGTGLTERKRSDRGQGRLLTREVTGI